MLITNTSAVVTPIGSPQRGRDLGKLSIIPNGAVLVQGEKIEVVGLAADLESRYPQETRVDAEGGAVVPGFVDPHTHIAWAGDRADEFEKRLEGVSYLEILAAGGGILTTVNATRSASLLELTAQMRARARTMLAHGTTTAEAKTGYGLEINTEIKQLQAIRSLNAEPGLELIPTFMGAHAVAPEFKGDPEGYTRHLCDSMLPAIKSWWMTEAANEPLPFVDVFCEDRAFDLDLTARILTTAQLLGFPLKIHADEFKNLGGVRLAVQLGAASADHLVRSSSEDIQVLGASDTVAVSLPCTPFGLADSQYTPAQDLIRANAILAIATDMNPGAAWCESMQFAICLACRYLKLTPAQALIAATINSAAAVQRDSSLGSLEPGKQADLNILSVSDFRHLGYRFGTNLVRKVIKRGVLMERFQ